MPRRTPIAAQSSKQDLTTQLLSQFKELIAHGVLRPGLKLPPERELSAQFRVSRSSLRHALKVLETMGIVRQRVGDGTYLTDSAATVLSQPLDFLFLIDGISLSDLMETRLIVEPELAARAAERANSGHLAALRHSMDSMKSAPDEQKLSELDVAFHDTIFQASANLLCTRLFSLIHRAIARSILLTSQLVDCDHTLSYHRPICDAIDRRNPDAARKAMTAHLLDARALLERAAGRETQQSQLKDQIRPVTKRVGTQLASRS